MGFVRCDHEYLNFKGGKFSKSRGAAVEVPYFLSRYDPDALRFTAGGTGGILQTLDWNGEVVWEWRLSEDERVQHHDVEPLPNGNLLVIAWELVSTEDAIAAGLRMGGPEDALVVTGDGFVPGATRFEIFGQTGSEPTGTLAAREKPITFLQPRGALPFWDLLRQKATLLPD